jgi:TRAP-type C4-dicarboxylate transport system substrate-binding protein
VQAWLPRNIVFANKDAWAALDEATQQAVTDCAATAAADGEAKAKELTNFYLEELGKNGMKVEAPGDTLKAELEGFGEIMTNEWLEEAGDSGKAIVDAYKSM